MNIKGTKILVTGGSLGIGKTTARKLIDGGAKVVITGRDSQRLQKAAKEIGAVGLQADVSDPASVDKTIAGTVDALGGLDVLVNNAGFGRFSKLTEVTWDDFEQVFRTNVFGTAMLTQKAVEIFIKQDYGHIVNIASTAALKGFEGGTVYAASKFALRAMTQCWQAELRKHNIRVIGINPSAVTTAFGSTSGEERPEKDNKLRSEEIAHVIVSALEMDDRGFIPELTVWATNPWD